MSELYRLNKDMLVKLITTIEDDHKKEMIELENKYKVENMNEEELKFLKNKVYIEIMNRFPRGPTGATGPPPPNM